jgi:hypothetical protein
MPELQAQASPAWYSWVDMRVVRHGAWLWRTRAEKKILRPIVQTEADLQARVAVCGLWYQNARQALSAMRRGSREAQTHLRLR